MSVSELPLDATELRQEAANLPEFTAEHPCPTYCNLPIGHESDSVRDDDQGVVRQSRCHGGPASEFGPTVSGGSTEYSDEPGVFHASILVVHQDDIDDPRKLVELAEQLVAATGWLIDQQGRKS